MDRDSNINVAVGKLSFEAGQLVENIQTVIDAVRAARPTGIRGLYFKSCSLSSTMGVGLRVNVRD